MMKVREEQQQSTQEIQQSGYSASKALDHSPFGLLASELLWQILGHFTLHELYALKQVCKSWQQTIQALPAVELLRAYEFDLKDSHLWHYLPASINDEPLV
jgi:F-box domain